MADFENMVLTLATGEENSVRRFAVQEALSQPFEVNLVVESESWTIELEPNVGQKAQFQLVNNAKDVQVRIWAGVCSHLALLQAEPQGNSTYLVRVVPKLWLLSQRRGHRIFQRKKLPDIVKAVLDEWKIVPKMQLTNEYLEHDYVVQYGETDLEFISRLLERAGITYYFDFAGMACDLVLSDAPHLNPPRGGPPIPWSDKPNESALAEWVSRVAVSYSVRPGHYAIRDFDFRRKPDFELIGKAEPAPAPENFYERYHYEPGEMKRLNPPDGPGSWPVHDDKGKVRHSMKEGERMAKERLRGERFGRRAVSFETNCTDITPGIILSVDDHPRNDLKPGDKLLVSSTRLEGVTTQKWTYTSEMVLADEPYHPPMVTPRPRIDGVQSAIVVGPPGEEIYTDEFGRVRVQFHWDRDGKYDDNSSCWMRVSQDWAGAGFGSVLIPRIGQEVLVAFLDGNPDEPMVVGRVYNAKLKVPYKLPDFKTRSGWKSDSTPGSNGFNEILMEDMAGDEMVYHQAQLDMQKLTKRAEVERVNENHIVVIGKERQTVVKTVQATMVAGVSVKQMIAKPSKEDLKILPQQIPSVSPLDTTIEMKANRVIFTTGKASVTFDEKKIQFQADGNITLVAKGGDVIMESNRCFINTMPPPPAAKPDPVQKVDPTTFQSNQGKHVKPPAPPPEAPEGAAADAMDAHKVGPMGQTPKIVQPPLPEWAGKATSWVRGEGWVDPKSLEIARRLVKPGGSGDAQDAELVARELAKYPPRVLEQMEKNGTKVVACRGSVTDYWTHLKGVQPRGWSPGDTWDGVPGAHSNNEVVVATIGHGSKKGAHVPMLGEGHGSQSVVLHEAGHALDRFSPGAPLHDGKAFQDARNADLAALSAYEKQPGDPGLAETFAEALATKYGGTSKAQKEWPNLMKHFDKGPP